MSAYFIFNYTVTDPKKYAQYREVVGPTIGQYKGKVLVASTDYETFEGSPQPILVVLEFESHEVAKAWYESEEYQAIKHLRLEASSDEGWSVIADQLGSS